MQACGSDVLQQDGIDAWMMAIEIEVDQHIAATDGGVCCKPIGEVVWPGGIERMVVQTDLVLSRREVGDGVVTRTARSGVENEGVGALEADQQIIATEAIDGVGARGAI